MLVLTARVISDIHGQHDSKKIGEVFGKLQEDAQ